MTAVRFFVYYVFRYRKTNMPNPSRSSKSRWKWRFPPDLLETLHRRFGMRPTREAAMSTSVGGIGPLLRDRIVGQAEAGLQVIGITLLYETTWIRAGSNGSQIHLEKREVAPYLREVLRDTGLVLILPALHNDTPIHAASNNWPFGKGRIYFLRLPLHQSSWCTPAKRMRRHRIRQKPVHVRPTRCASRQEAG